MYFEFIFKNDVSKTSISALFQYKNWKRSNLYELSYELVGLSDPLVFKMFIMDIFPWINEA